MRCCVFCIHQALVRFSPCPCTRHGHLLYRSAESTKHRVLALLASYLIRDRHSMNSRRSCDILGSTLKGVDVSRRSKADCRCVVTITSLSTVLDYCQNSCLLRDCQEAEGLSEGRQLSAERLPAALTT